MLEKILTKLAQKIYKEQDISVELIDGKMFLHQKDTKIYNNYVLSGTYSYDEVIKINSLIKGNAGFGICEELGPIAFIGVPNPENAEKNGYFRYKVQSYGTPFDKSQVFFEAYTEEKAKSIKNYKVYGFDGVEEVSKLYPISDLNYQYDSRYKAKEANVPKVFDMDCKLKGVHNYSVSKILATGSIRDKDGYSGEEHPIVFATVGKNKHVGIINMWPCDKRLVRGFRDVWEYGKDEPDIERIRFLMKEEATEIDDFELYVYNYACSGIGRDKYQVEKFDRTLDKRFKFQLSDGRDYRLIEHKELFK